MTTNAAAAPPPPSDPLDALLEAAQRTRTFSSPFQVRLGTLEGAVKHAREVKRASFPDAAKIQHARLMAAAQGFDVGVQALRHIALSIHDHAGLTIPTENARRIVDELFECSTRIMREA